MSEFELIQDGIDLPEDTVLVNVGAGYISYTRPDDTPVEWVELRVRDTPVIIQREVGNTETLLVGIGGPLGSLVMLAAEKLDAYIRSHT